MFCQYSLDLDNNLNINCDDLFKKVIGLLKVKKKLTSIVQIEKKSQGVEDLIEKCNHKTCISSISSCIITLPFIPNY